MRYGSGQLVRVGDKVNADGMVGVVVCDFDHRQCAEGYENFLNGGEDSEEFPNSGVMIKSEEAGLIHYPEDDPDILLIG